MKRILLLLPTNTYRAQDFLRAAKRLGVEVVIASEHPQTMATYMGDRALVVPLDDDLAAVEAITKLNARAKLDAVLAVDGRGLLIAAKTAKVLGLPHNPLDAVSATLNKALMRDLFALHSVPQPKYQLLPIGQNAKAVATQIGYPCVIKPTSRSGSQGVIRVNSPDEVQPIVERIREIPGLSNETLIVETFVEGEEVAVEGLVIDGQVSILAVFDKPIPLDGPFFEETIYTTPTRHPIKTQKEIERVCIEAVKALGLTNGPIHAELRVSHDGAVVIIEIASRSIGGLCSRALKFGNVESLEELIIRHALGLEIVLTDNSSEAARDEKTQGKTLGKNSVNFELQKTVEASGVMMIPIRAKGRLDKVLGQKHALAVDGIVGLEITIPTGKDLIPLPEGDRYLGFIFARGPTPYDVEMSLRTAESMLQVQLLDAWAD